MGFTAFPEASREPPGELRTAIVRHVLTREHMRRKEKMAKQISIAAMLTICICLVTLTAQPVLGQAVYGSIIGTVTDPQGAAVANAKVTVTNQRKGTTDTTTTNESGNYSVTHLIPDIYTVRIEAPGFKASEQKDVIVSADPASNVPLQFQVGGTSETVA